MERYFIFQLKKVGGVTNPVFFRIRAAVHLAPGSRDRSRHFFPGKPTVARISVLKRNQPKILDPVLSTNRTLKI